jgi:hypothetical protein
MRSNTEDSSAFNQILKSGRFSHSRSVLDGDDQITTNGSLVNFFDPNGANRNVALPVLEKGRFYVVSNIGSAFNLLVNNSVGTLITTLLPGDTALLFASDGEWVALRGWAALGVFTNTINGLVPAPNSVTPGLLFLRDDGQWAQVQSVGIVDAFKFMTDGTNTAIGSGPDTFWYRSSDNTITLTVTNGEAVFGDNLNLTVNEAAVDHNALLNYVADQHVAHSSITLTAGTGLSGGGTIAANRTFNLDLNDLTADTPVLADTFAFYDISGADTNKATITALNSILDHNALVNYVANRHIDHSGVSIVAGSGLTGGGTIEASRTLTLDINGLAADAIATGDFLPFWDISGTDNNKITFGNLVASIDHNALLNYVANQHVDHTSVTLTAGAGLTGGGTIAANRTFTVGAGTGITVNADDVALDTAHSRNVDHSAVSISTTEGIQGGGTIAATRTLKLDINGLTADATPDSAADYVTTYDASAGLHKKVLIANLPGGLNITGLTATTPVLADEFPVYDVSAAANRKITVGDLGSNFFVQWDSVQALTAPQQAQAQANLDVPGLSVSNTFAGTQTFLAWNASSSCAITQSANANVGLTITNANAGASAAASLALVSDVNTGSNIRVYSSTRATYLNLQANRMTLYTAHASGMHFLADNAAGFMSWAMNGAIRMTLAADGGLTMASPVGGSKGSGTINAIGVYDDNVLLTCPALAKEFLESGTVDLEYWDSTVPDVVMPEVKLNRQRKERVIKNEVAYEEQEDGSYLAVRRQKEVELEVFELMPVHDEYGNGVDAIEVPVYEPEEIVPEQRTKRQHKMAHLLKSMLDEGFDPRNPISYIQKLRKDEALPGMPTKENWEHNALSIGEIHNRLWLATEMVALVMLNLHDRVTALEGKQR